MYRCPECGSEGPFRISASTTVTWNSEEDVDAGDLEWGADDWMMCPQCLTDGIVEAFTERTAKE